jgi:predicted amino acid racemase
MNRGLGNKIAAVRIHEVKRMKTKGLGASRRTMPRVIKMEWKQILCLLMG